MTEEIWKDVVGFPGYSVSNLGRIKGKRGHILKPSKDRYGYLCINISSDQKVTLRIHRLVALAFIPVIPTKDYVDHINRDKTNNTVENLRWVTQSENNLNKNNNSSTPYITLFRDKYYKVRIIRNKEKFSRYFRTMEEAEIARDIWLSQYED